MRTTQLQSYGKVVVMLCLGVAAMVATGYAAEGNEHAQHSAADSKDQASSSESSGLVRVEAKYVCMPNNKRFDKEQLRIEIEDKTYYGCCKMCVSMLQVDPKVRTAIDPVSGKKVDKAEAVIGAAADNSVYYFENEENLKKFEPKAKPR